MKIAPSNVLNIYNTNSSKNKPIDKALPKVGEPRSAVKTDIVSINRENLGQKVVQRITTDIVNEVMEEDSVEKINQLKEKIANNQYDSSGSSISDAILDKIFSFKKEI